MLSAKRRNILSIDRFTFAAPFLRLLSPEAAHRATIHGMRLGLAGHDREPDDSILATRDISVQEIYALNLQLP